MFENRNLLSLHVDHLISAMTPKSKDYPLYIKAPDKDGKFTRVLKKHKFRDSNKTFYFEPKFLLKSDFDSNFISRCDRLFEAEDVVGVKSKGFIPTNLTDYRNYCRQQYQDYKDREIFINPIALALGLTEPSYNDKAVTSTKYHI